MPPIHIDISTIGATMLSLASPLTVVLWKYLPAKKRGVDVAVLENDFEHLRADVDELKRDVKSLVNKLL